MAMADYRLCDVCGDKAFYDSNLNYEISREKTELREAGNEGSYYTLDYVGDWAVICTDCSRTHKTAIVARDALTKDEYREALQKLSDAVEDTMREHYKELGCCSVTRARLDEAKELLARPEPDIEDEVNEGVWQLKLEGDRQDAAVFEAFGSCEPAAAEKARELFTLEEWNESDGEVLWWRFPIVEPPYVGSPVCSDWPWDEDEEGDHVDHYTHWTRIPLPSPPAATGE